MNRATSMKGALALVTLGAAAAWVPVACTFPDVSFEGEGGGASTSSSSSSSGGAGGPSAGGGGQGGAAQGGGGQGGAGGVGQGGAGGGGGPVDECDVDGDGIPSAKPGCENAVGGGGQGGAGGVQYDCDDDDDGQDGELFGCTGTDCDDADDRVFDGQEEYFTAARADGTYDFDCDGFSTPLYFPTNECTCSGLCLNCGDNKAFLEDVACGAFGELAQCATNLALQCVPDEDDTTESRQPCR